MSREPSSLKREEALNALRALLSEIGPLTAARAFELLAVLEAPSVSEQEAVERDKFGCTAAMIDETLDDKAPRDVAIYVQGALSNAVNLIQRNVFEGEIRWTVSDRNANTLRQFINIAKYALSKLALP